MDNREKRKVKNWKCNHIQLKHQKYQHISLDMRKEYEIIKIIVGKGTHLRQSIVSSKRV